MSALVAFDSGHLHERGTDVAVWDYAHFNEDLLGNRSVVLCPAQAERSALDRFAARFTVCLYRDRTDLERLLANVDLYYVLDAGQYVDRPRPPRGRLAVHCVFRADQPHGDVYAAISPWVVEHHGSPGVPVVPHVVQTPAPGPDLRTELGIPVDATVLGRHGGRDTFNLPFVHDAVRQAVAEREDLWLVLLNTAPFAEHPRIVHLPACTDPARKAAFVRTCDAMLHARAEGETFGLSVAEFSVCNKPVLTWRDSYDRAHIEVLGDKGLYYRDAKTLLRILRRIAPVRGDFDAFSQRFAPEVVMRAFEQVFLGAAGERPQRGSGGAATSGHRSATSTSAATERRALQANTSRTVNPYG